jgi:hypothetical protein
VAKRALVLALLPLALAACGGDDNASETTVPTTAVTTTTSATTGATTTTTTSTQPTSVAVYFLRDGRVSPTRVSVGSTQRVARAALRALSNAPPEGYSSEIVGTEQLDVSIEDGVAKITWDARTLPHQAAAQVVYTLTQFPTIREVELPDGTTASRADFEDVSPPVLIEKPLPRDRVRSPIAVSGTASVFEATLVVELVQAGKVLERKTVTASEGAPGRGTFTTSFETVATGPAAIAAFSPSAEDGSEQHRVDVPIRITRP